MTAAHPAGDWQFWIVTLLAIGAAVIIIRSLIPASWWPAWLRRRLRRRSPGARTTLTVSARRRNAD